LVGKFALDIKKFLQKQGKVIIGNIVKQVEALKKDNNNKTVDNILTNCIPASQNIAMTSLIEPILIEIYQSGVKVTTASINATLDSGDDGVFQGLAKDYAATRTAELVTNLDDSTRDMLRSDLEQYMNDGITPAQMAQNLQDNYAFSEARSLTIARTETGFAWNNAGISTMKQGGAKGVTVFDGDSDEACAEADGQNWSFDYAQDHSLEHPNCVRSFGPMSDGDDFDEE
jgi:hypothetical protein